MFWNYYIQLQFAETGITLVWGISIVAQLFQNLESEMSFCADDASIAKHGQF